jgi:hypothetical protein
MTFCAYILERPDSNFCRDAGFPVTSVVFISLSWKIPG